MPPTTIILLCHYSPHPSYKFSLFQVKFSTQEWHSSLLSSTWWWPFYILFLWPWLNFRYYIEADLYYKLSSCVCLSSVSISSSRLICIVEYKSIPHLLTAKQGWWNDSAGKGSCHKVWQPEFNTWDSHDRRRLLTPIICFLTYTYVGAKHLHT